ncbi:Tex family protein [Luteibaculum oceani]|uniref:RNA-binding transcriptional accessory protein n=1 Tax=Luteibaculum oceani TaxID=1294296 RepID=A0A5C6VKA8_9FLAO|nr:Tex family protein [Luteibaculum oceani]TXC85459.1 RNA-binding transcriptional accessory protein [Luteibaculum oceani]
MQADSFLSQQLGFNIQPIKNTLALLDEGATVPFISRYRKERTGGLDEVAIQTIKDAYKAFQELEKRKEFVLKTIDEQGNLSEELKEKITQCTDLTTLEDLYLPFKPKRKTKAEAARKLGLEPLAGTLMKQSHNDVEVLALRFVRGEVSDVETALSGARDIMAEWISERAVAREIVRTHFGKSAQIAAKVVKGKDDQDSKYRDYFDFSEPLKRCPSHRLLAIRRAEAEGVLRVSISPDQEEVLHHLNRYFIKGNNEAADQVSLAITDAYKRLLKPSIETEFKNSSKEKADLEAINVFAENIRQLLLAPPLGAKRILAIDPGFRTGCKVVCLDEQGGLLHNETIYPHEPQNDKQKAASKLHQLIEAYKIEAIAIGNGTAGRETEYFVKNLRLPQHTETHMVNESGASIYSASAIAREEFPNYDVTVRGAVSIGRRLMDPLSELVKIEPKSIGVGQYQHDVDQKLLKEKLDQTVESVVNHVGVNLNTSSEHLLQYVSGIGPKLAKNIVSYRSEIRKFNSRKQLLKVSGLGAKAFEQCAGFLRIRNGKNPLDNSAVHPESYPVVENMAKHLNVDIKELIGNAAALEKIQLEEFTTNTIGLPTLKDIKKELLKPGRDPRGKATVFEFSKDVSKMEDLREGMILPGLVTNITKFGAFVDVGVKQDGLVHISQLADRYVSDPNEIVKLQQQVKVRVLEVDLSRKRIAFTMKI